MYSAVLRIIAITAGCLILGVFAVFFIRTMGLKQNFAPPPHKWFENTEWRIWNPPGCVPGPAPNGWIRAITVHSKNGEWLDECGQPVAESIKDASDVLLIVKATETELLDKLVENVGAFDRTKRFAVAAEAQRVARSLRHKAPQWIFAADSASLMRLRLFSGLWIETAIDFWPDFVIATSSGSHAFEPRMRQELTRRGRRIVWQGEAAPYPVQGFMSPSTTDGLPK